MTIVKSISTIFLILMEKYIVYVSLWSNLDNSHQTIVRFLKLWKLSNQYPRNLIIKSWWKTVQFVCQFVNDRILIILVKFQRNFNRKKKWVSLMIVVKQRTKMPSFHRWDSYSIVEKIKENLINPFELDIELSRIKKKKCDLSRRFFRKNN